MCLVCAAYTASVLDNAFGRLGYEEREDAFARCDEILGEFASWPFGAASGASEAVSTPRRRTATARIATGGSGDAGRESILGLLAEVRKESIGGDEDVSFELVAGVLEVLSKLDSLL